MEKKALPIRLARLEANRKLACDVFIHLPLNERYIRLAIAGDELSAAQIERLAKKGVTSLFVFSEENADPETFPVYAPDVQSASENRVAPEVPQLSENPDKNETNSLAIPPVISPEEAPAVIAVGPESEPVIRISASAEPEPLVRVVKGSPEVEAEETTLLSRDTEEAYQQLISGTPPADPGSLLFTIKSALAAEKVSEEIVTLAASREACSEEEKIIVRGKIDELEEVLTRIENRHVTAEEIEQRFAKDPEIEEFRAVFSSSDPDAGLKASNRLIQMTEKRAAAKKQLSLLEAGSEPDRSAGNGIEQLLKKSPGDLAKTEREALSSQLKSVLVTEKISAEIIKVSEEIERLEGPDKERKIAELAGLEEAMTLSTSGHALPAEMEHRFPVDREAQEFMTAFENGSPEAVSKRIAQANNLRNSAMENLNKNQTALLRAKVNRDLPATVSRLCAYLAYSAGYTDLKLLSELALAAILYFAKKEEGTSLATTPLPAFVQSILDFEEMGDLVVEDAVEIVQVVEAYLNDPECDRSQRDFVKRIFDRTIDDLHRSSREIDFINLARWQKFTERGPDLTGHSLCTKASAYAIKQSKSIII